MKEFIFSDEFMIYGVLFCWIVLVIMIIATIFHLKSWYKKQHTIKGDDLRNILKSNERQRARF